VLIKNSSPSYFIRLSRLLSAVEDLVASPLFPLKSSREWEKSKEAKERSQDANYLLLLRALLQAVGEVRLCALWWACYRS
jgi:hypothetical protein